MCLETLAKSVDSKAPKSQTCRLGYSCTENQLVIQMWLESPTERFGFSASVAPKLQIRRFAGQKINQEVRCGWRPPRNTHILEPRSSRMHVWTNLQLLLDINFNNN